MNDLPKSGDVYLTSWDERPLRIIAADEFEALYDCELHGGGWTFAAALKKPCSFYRTSSDMFAKAKRLRTEPFTVVELSVFRPDLPLRTIRSETRSWTDDIAQAPRGAAGLACSPLAIHALTRSMRTSKAVVIEAGDRKGFGADELWIKAKGVQLASNAPSPEGVGLYRLGSLKGIPSFYIGGFRDLAGLLDPIG